MRKINFSYLFIKYYNNYHVILKKKVMNKIYLYMLLSITLITCLFLTACEEDVNTADLNEAPKIALSVKESTLIGVNLGDTAKYPALEGTVQADAGLQEVKIELIKESGTELLSNFTAFDEVSRIIFVLDTVPVYTPELSAIRISAVDEQGRTVERTVSVETYLNPGFEPAEGLPGTLVTITGVDFVAEEIESVAIGDVEAAAFTVAPDGSSITFEVPEDAIADRVIINRKGSLYPFISKDRFRVLSNEPKVLVSVSNVVTRGQGVRNDNLPTAFSAQGATYMLMDGTDETSREIDFITADSGGDDALDLFAPGEPGWLPGNYFEGPNDEPVIWPVLNVTEMEVIPDVGEEYFTNATKEDIEALTFDAPKTRISLAIGEVGVVIKFRTAEGEKGLIYYKAHDPMDAGSKGDQFTFDIKVLQ